jgi:hypothetical protein
MIKTQQTQPPTPETLKDNWDRFLDIIDTYISSPRKEQLLDFYQNYEERFIFSPASHKREYHNAYAGGYISHVLNVIDCALELDKVWRKMNCKDTYTTEELVFSAINHDLGKFGDFDHEAVIESQDQWRKEKLGELYQFNTKLTYMTVPDRGLWILGELGISTTQNEYLSIKLHDGLYDQANEPYLKSYMSETKPRTSLIFLLHQADLMAARIEWEHECLDSLYKEPVKKTTTFQPKKSAQEKAIRQLGSKNNDLLNALKNL